MDHLPGPYMDMMQLIRKHNSSHPSLPVEEGWGEVRGERHASRSGQTLVIAIMVMFILAVVATVFIALVARNLFRSERYSRTDTVAQITEAGVKYADEMLTTSEDGADWRPVPDNATVTDPGNPALGIEPVPDTSDTLMSGTPNWEFMREEHPDYKWVRAYWPSELPSGAASGTGYAGPTGGFTTVQTGEGRFLLRVSYNPNPNDALSKYIKIESIGRWGQVLTKPYDPTTWRSGGNYHLRREITAFKPIGLTEYLRFVTNKDNRSMDMHLGVPGFRVRFGRPGYRQKFGGPAEPFNGARGGPIRVNGNLVWHGDYENVNDASASPSIDIYLRGIHGRGDGTLPVEEMPLDKVEASGDIKVDTDPAGNGAVKVAVHRLIGGSISSSDVKPSDDSAFTTLSGFYRDGRDTTDTMKRARGVKRLEPPLVDQADPTATTTRYRLLTLNSGDRIRGASGRWINLGQLGWGRGVYINNSRDRQDESETLVGGYTLRSDWIKPNNPTSTYWKGPYYIPPAATIVLHPNDTDGDGQPDFTITRTDTLANGQKPVWCDAWGNPHPEWGQTITMPYPDAVNGRDVSMGSGVGAQTKHLDGNGVVYAEGNIRIRGMLPKGIQLTIVSNENIYIDGSVLKYRDSYAVGINDNDPWRATGTNGEDTNSCGLALLARKNVVVNTTQFFSPLNSISADDVGSDAENGQPPFHLVVGNSPESQLRCTFEFAPWESEGAQYAPSNWMLFLRQSGQYGPSYINAWMNPGSDMPSWGILYLNDIFPGLPQHVWGVGDHNFGAPGWGIGSAFTCDVFDLDPTHNANLFTAPGEPNLLQIGLDQTTYTRNNYLMGGLAIQPYDIRIEALLYAQEGSFFVIPGNWFNPDPADRPGGPRKPGTDPRFPYFGQPLDIRIIVDGTVSENIPAAVGDVEEWMAKWGRIPEKYGSSDINTAHPGEGITFLYDDHAAWPVLDLTNPVKPIRADKFGRPLPIAPRLPVSGSIIYSGDIM